MLRVEKSEDAANSWVKCHHPHSGPFCLLSKAEPGWLYKRKEPVSVAGTTLLQSGVFPPSLVLLYPLLTTFLKHSLRPFP